MLPSMDLILGCKSEDELRAEISRYTAVLGFSTWLYVVKSNWPNTPPYALSSFPSAWIAERLQQILAGTDGAVAQCKENLIPFLWNDTFAADALERYCPSFFRPPADFGLRGGISAPVHGLGSHWGMLAVATADPIKNASTLHQQLPIVHLLSAFVHQSGQRFAFRSENDAPMHLTRREIECLHWTALGKTGWEISQMLAISERTVAFHIDNAAHKLGVFGRRQAVARAMALHLIDL